MSDQPFYKYFNSSLQKDSENKKIIATLNKCGVTSFNDSNLIIDEATYFAFKKSKLPIMTQYTWEAFRGEKPNINFPKSLGYTGLIAKCNRLPIEVRNETKKHGRYCCIKF